MVRGGVMWPVVQYSGKVVLWWCDAQVAVRLCCNVPVLHLMAVRHYAVAVIHSTEQVAEV